MKPTILNMPESSDAVGPWLEDVLSGGDLRGLVAELRAVHGDSDDNLQLDAVMGDRKHAVANQGLAALNRETITLLLTHPNLLLDLQEFLIVEGEEYWTSKFNADTESAHNAAENVLRRINDEIPESDLAIKAPESEPPTRRFLSLAIAASVLCIVATAWLLRPFGGDEQIASTTWGWANEQSTPQDASPDEYLNAIADGAQAWFKKPPSDKESLIKRLREFNDGCQRLIEMEHTAAQPRRPWVAQIQLPAMEEGDRKPTRIG
ncbi:MAG: hypothetical protein R3C05_16410 [Pirellulaceae bacterium]